MNIFKQYPIKGFPAWPTTNTPLSFGGAHLLEVVTIRTNKHWKSQYLAVQTSNETNAIPR